MFGTELVIWSKQSDTSIPRAIANTPYLYTTTNIAKHVTFLIISWIKKISLLPWDWMAIKFAVCIGLNNLITAITSNGSSFIIDGRYIKSLNQWFNKENARLTSIHYKQLKIKGNDSRIKIPYTKRQLLLLDKRNKRINDYISKSCRYIINYCIDNDIGNIILGYNPDIQKEANIGKANNQSFVSIPIAKLKDKLTYLSKLYGINLILQEESYTSKASFFDEDEIPTYSKNDDYSSSYIFSGNRIKRGLYKTSSGILINADINGSLNILKKALLNTSKADDCKNILNSLCIDNM